MDRGLSWASAASAIGLGAMGAIALIVEPPLVALRDLPQRLGSTVAVEGVIASLDTRLDGWTRARLQDQNDSIDLISDAHLNVSAGDRVRATGHVGTYGGRIQLSIESAGDVLLLRAWRENHIALDELLLRPTNHLETNVRTSGIVDGRMLASTTGDAGIPLRGAQACRGPCIVQGLFAFDATRAQYYLQVEYSEPDPAPA